MQGQCVLLPIDDQLGMYRCMLCGWQNKTPRDRPPRRNCGKAPKKHAEPIGLRTVAEVDQLIATYCAECDHYPADREVCKLDKGCKKNVTADDWRRKLRDKRYTCAVGKWETNGQPAIVSTRPPDGRAVLANVTACVTAFKRPDSLRRLLASLAKHYPQLAVDVEDTGGNLSAGRNRLVARCKTPFVLILEDDFEAIPTSNLDSLCDVLNADEQLGLVCGSLIEGGRITAHAKDTRLFRGVLEATSPPADPWRLTVSGVRWRFCDAAANFLLARREVLVENPWDERLELMEHAPWFWTLKDRGLWKVGYTEDACLIHYRDRPTGEYTSHRSRTAPFTELVRTEYGFSRVVDVSRQPPEPTDNRPNVIIFGAGHQGTRLYMQVLEQLGWDIGGENLKRRVMENQRFVEINKAMLRERGVCDCGGLATVLADECDCARCGKTFCRAPTDDDPAGFFASLVDPWAIKDPRFVLTCSDSRWRAELDRVRPVFVLAERDIDQTRATYRRHGWDSGVIFGYAIKELRAIARREFEAWPHQKLAISFEQLTAAAKQVEWDRD